ncbi:MAG: DUF1549 domain-containing protein [Planctomycetaceae bacterium]|nr:DUF1549 domain-containing protein [Planctomycetaceae bacterium]
MIASAVHRHFSCAVLSIGAVLVGCPALVNAGDALRHRVDQILSDSAIGPVAGDIDDATFLRRAYLDLAGRIPSTDESRVFLADQSPGRREQLVNRLLDSRDFARHMATTLDVMFMERRGGQHVTADRFRQWLEESVTDGRPLHHLVRDLVAAETPADAPLPAAAFILERDVEPHLLTRDIGRIFFGMDLQCAQCHDHPLVDDYRQDDYYGLHAFVSRLSLFQPDKKKKGRIAEAPDGLASFKSVFTQREAFTTPRLPGDPEIEEPNVPVDHQYSETPSKTSPGIPVYSRRQALAALLEKGENEFFRRNLANRLWAMVFGRGLVHPVDMHHSSNPPSHPELLHVLANELAAMNFNLKAFLRELVLTDAWQRSHLMPETDLSTDAALAARIEEVQQTREKLLQQAREQSVAATEVFEQLDEILKQAEPVRAAWINSRSAATKAVEKAGESTADLESREKVLGQKQAASSAMVAAIDRIKVAAELLNQPAELKNAAATLSGKLKTLTTETEKLQKEADGVRKKAEEAVRAATTARESERGDQSKLAPMLNEIRSQRGRLVQQWGRSQQAYVLVAHFDENAGQLKQLRQMIQEQDQLQGLLKELQASRQAVASLKSQLQAMAGNREQLLTQLKEARTLEQQICQDADAMRSLMSDRETTSDRLREATQHVLTAASMLQDSALQTASQELRQRADAASRSAEEVQVQLRQIQKTIDAAESDVTRLQQQEASLRENLEAMTTAEQVAQTELARMIERETVHRQNAERLQADLMKSCTERFQVASISGLSPEQFAWSLLQATGQLERQYEVEESKLNKEQPLTPEQQQEDAIIVKRKEAIHQAAVEKLNKSAASIVTLFGAEAGQPQDGFFATVDQALFLDNGGTVRSWLAPSGNNLIARTAKLTSPEQIAEEMYLSVLVRRPKPEEIADVAEYLKARESAATEALQELAWALLTSAEFRFRH